MTTIEIRLLGYYNDETYISAANFNVTQTSPTRGSTVNMSSIIFFDRNPPNLLWESVIHIPPPPQDSTVAPRTFFNAITSREDVSNNEVDTSITPFSSPQISPIFGRCRLDPNNPTNELINIGPEYILDNSIPNQITFRNAFMIFRCLNGTNLFTISYNGRNELNGLATAFAGSIFNGSPTDDQDVMAAHLSNILSQFSRVYP